MNVKARKAFPNISHSQFPNNGILRINSYNIVNSRCEYFLVLSILDVNIFSYWASSGGLCITADQKIHVVCKQMP